MNEQTIIAPTSDLAQLAANNKIMNGLMLPGDIAELDQLVAETTDFYGDFGTKLHDEEVRRFALAQRHLMEAKLHQLQETVPCGHEKCLTFAMLDDTARVILAGAEIAARA